MNVLLFEKNGAVDPMIRLFSLLYSTFGSCEICMSYKIKDNIQNGIACVK